MTFFLISLVVVLGVIVASARYGVDSRNTWRGPPRSSL